MWNKSIAIAQRCVIICLFACLLAAQNQVSARSLTESDEHSCLAIKSYLDKIGTKGKDFPSICNGKCCGGTEERYLQNKSINSFVHSLRIQSKEISQKMVDTNNVYKGYISELFEETKSKTINIFAKVYPKTISASRTLVEKLFSDIKSSNGHSIGPAMRNFFRNLFPVAYHRFLYADSGERASPAASMDFHEDYKQCLVSSYDNLSPFGDIPRFLARAVDRSLTASNMFVVALERGSEVLASVEQLDDIAFDPKCLSHLLKMNYCQDCNGSPKIKSCRGYCLNVMRGCLTQHVGSLDRPWSTYAQSLEQLVHIVRSKDGYESVLRDLDGRLSEAVMHFMQHGLELEQKVKKLCGTPSISNVKLPLVATSAATVNSEHKITPPVTEMLQFLVTIDSSKNIYTQIVDSYCNDNEDFQQDDKNCWIGDRISHYSQTVMEPGMTTQKYNPEVPYEGEGFRVNSQVNELVDKLISNRQKMSNVMSQHSGHTDSDGMISDMAEGSGSSWRSEFPDDSDFNSDGSGSGDGYSGLSKVPIPERPTYQPPVVIHNPRNDKSGAAVMKLHVVALLGISLISLVLLRTY